MAFKPFIFACVVASVLTLTQARSHPMGVLAKRHPEERMAPELVPEAFGTSVDDQTYVCIINYVVHAPEDQKDQLGYKELAQECHLLAEAQVHGKPVAPDNGGDAIEQDTRGPDNNPCENGDAGDIFCPIILSDTLSTLMKRGVR